MADPVRSGNLSALIQVQSTIPSRTMTRAGVNSTNPQQNAEADKAMDAAKKFEALLIHNMLKSMRKTTMAEDTSNERAIYDDMLDEKIANTMMDAGGLGVAKQILSQIRDKDAVTESRTTQQSLSTADTLRIRQLMQDDTSSTKESVATPGARSGQPKSHSDKAWELYGIEDGSIRHGSLATGVSSDADLPQSIADQHSFLAPLISHARRGAEKLGTTPEAVLAIAALETGWGKSMIRNEHGENSFNLFGIKATSSSQVAALTKTTEYVDGAPVRTEALFKVFNSSAEAVDGFSDFLLENPRYSTALQHAANPERFLRELQNAGYATDPDYADKAISVMKQIESHPLPL